VNAALASGTLSAAERFDVADSLAENAKDLRRDLLALEHFQLPPDLVETETKVRTSPMCFGQGHGNGAAGTS